ncbi:MAG: ATP-binding protein [Suipraeoptans sp.]
MKEKQKSRFKRVRNTLFPRSMFWILFLLLLLVGSLHTGLYLILSSVDIHGGLATLIMLIYWVIVATVLTIYSMKTIRNKYEKPMKDLAKATDAVAHGDFSVYLPTIHTAQKYDYLDVMILDFNKMVEELGSIETLKTDFFSNVSHEIKTPLAAINGYAQSLKHDDLTKEEEQEYIENIISSSNRLSGLITNILKLNRLEKQSIAPISEKYDLCRQIVDCALSFEEQWDKKQIELDMDIDDECFIEADESLMDIVWNNLISNAVKFTDSGGKISIKQTVNDDVVIVSISDSGCGMDARTVEHIFEKFYQGDSSHATEGNGLGLAMVNRIVDIINGKIEVKSNPGIGTEFVVTLMTGGGKQHDK